MVHPRKLFDSGYLQRQHGVQIWAFSLRVRTEKATSKTHVRGSFIGKHWWNFQPKSISLDERPAHRRLSEIAVHG